MCSGEKQPWAGGVHTRVELPTTEEKEEENNKDIKKIE
jgi:hypothetical protein